MKTKEFAPCLDEEEYRGQLKLLQAEHDKKWPSLAVEIRIMDATFNNRRNWIAESEPVVEEILTTFPCLDEERHVKLFCLVNVSLYLVPLFYFSSS